MLAVLQGHREVNPRVGLSTVQRASGTLQITFVRFSLESRKGRAQGHPASKEQIFPASSSAPWLPLTPEGRTLGSGVCL